MFKQASQQKLRYQTPRGVLTTEQLWDLSLTDLYSSIRAVKKLIKKDNDDDLSFLDDTQKTDPENELRFNILKEVYTTKKKANEALRDEKANKVHNQKILELIASKKNSELQGKSVEELEAMLK